jgi:caa(3)-type oxidase subunit IV
VRVLKSNLSEEILFSQVYGLLVILLLCTVAASFMGLARSWTFVVAGAIAAAKAALIGLYFMDVRKSRALLWGALATLIFLGTLAALILIDYLTR